MPVSKGETFDTCNSRAGPNSWKKTTKAGAHPLFPRIDGMEHAQDQGRGRLVWNYGVRHRDRRYDNGGTQGKGVTIVTIVTIVILLCCRDQEMENRRLCL